MLVEILLIIIIIILIIYIAYLHNLHYHEIKGLYSRINNIDIPTNKTIEVKTTKTSNFIRKKMDKLRRGGE